MLPGARQILCPLYVSTEYPKVWNLEPKKEKFYKINQIYLNYLGLVHRFRDREPRQVHNGFKANTRPATLSLDCLPRHLQNTLCCVLIQHICPCTYKIFVPNDASLLNSGGDVHTDFTLCIHSSLSVNLGPASFYRGRREVWWSTWWTLKSVKIDRM